MIIKIDVCPDFHRFSLAAGELPRVPVGYFKAL